MNTVANLATIPRAVIQTLRGQPASDGAGVKLTRVIGQPKLPDLDPFLLLDEFGTDKAEDYIAGFPDHPHRGFETVTYMLDGRMRHKDNHGNEGVLEPGAVQWMTAGRGIVHSEMPEQREGRMRGFQLWMNLPAKDKMTAPNYQEFGGEKLPVVEKAGVSVKVIAGQFDDAVGPVRQPATDPTYMDIRLDAGVDFSLPAARGPLGFRVRVRGRPVGGRVARSGDDPCAGAGGARRRRRGTPAGSRGPHRAPSSWPAVRCANRWRVMARS